MFCVPLSAAGPREWGLSHGDSETLPRLPYKALTQPKGSVCVQLRGAQRGGAGHGRLIAHLKGAFPLFPGGWG